MSKQELEPYEVYALRYATAMRRSTDVFIGGDAHDSPLPMDYFVWLARNSRHTVVIDTGFDQAAATRRERQLLRSPDEGLRLLGVNPREVAHVIITHLHYDHAGNLGLFPRARFYLQDSEMAYATGRHMGTRFFAHAYEPDDVLAMVRLAYDGRIQFHDGAGEIVPGISVHHVGGHTLGLQAVRVFTRVGWLVLASDAAHYLDNMLTGRPFPIVADVTQMVQGWATLRQLASEERHIVPGHDPIVMQRYRAPEPGLQGVAVRLDDEPQPKAHPPKAESASSTTRP
jgi:glyoxylase-like metal-dependent hydrolase (beta-lactamase superfamily II)